MSASERCKDSCIKKKEKIENIQVSQSTYNNTNYLLFSYCKSPVQKTLQRSICTSYTSSCFFLSKTFQPECKLNYSTFVKWVLVLCFENFSAVPIFLMELKLKSSSIEIYTCYFSLVAFLRSANVQKFHPRQNQLLCYTPNNSSLNGRRAANRTRVRTGNNITFSLSLSLSSWPTP